MNQETVLLLSAAGLIMASSAVTSVFFLIREVRMLREQREDPKRHTHSVNAGIEDGMSTMISTVRMAQEARTQAEAIEFFASKALSIMQDMREGPYSYDPNRPSGDRNEAVMHASRKGA